MKPAKKDIKLKLKNLPTSPGVYLFKNSKGKTIYIGKACNLRNRVRTYFQSASRHDPRIARMVNQIDDFELLVTENEIESLILEANLVKEHHPRYNVRLKDDKHFPYIKVTTNEAFPRVIVVRRFDDDGATYFGPYTSSRGMRKTLTFLTRLFRIRTCNYILPPPEGKSYQVCLDYRIKRCDGACEGHQTEEDYNELVNSVIMVLTGKSKALINQLEEKMHLASGNEKYEKAKIYRDQIEALNSVMFKQNVDVGKIVNRDIVSIARESSLAIAVIMQIREGVLIGRQDFQLAIDTEEKDDQLLEGFVTQYYNNQPNIPREIYLPNNINNQKLVESWLRKIKGSAIKLIMPQKGEKVRLVDLAAKNARLLLDELLIQRKTYSERTSKMVTALQDALKLQNAPRSIVCFDISNTGETDAVGSAVFFENGKPKRSRYRHFKIKGITGQDDFAMMREVVGRYFHRLKDEKQSLPDLVVVDGGKGQLSSTMAELKSLDLESQVVVGLAKRLEELYLTNHSDPLTIPKNSPALMLLKQVRDEAHRFAVSYNKKVRTKRTIKSALDDIPGIGPAKRSALIRKFGSVAKIKQAAPQALAEIKGITPVLAERILSVLNNK